MLIVGEAPEDGVRELGREVLGELEELGERTWSFSYIFVRSMNELDPSLKAMVATEGITLLGKPDVSSKGLEPHILFQYDVSELSSTERKRFYRALNATDLSKYRQGSTLLIPASDAEEAEELLMSHGVVRRRAKVFIKT